MVALLGSVPNRLATQGLRGVVARILAVEPYYGGSHRAFIDGWMQHSEHEFDLITLPAHHWKWRMRHAAVSVVAELQALAARNAGAWDLCWVSSMMNLAELRGLVGGLLATTPCVAYFHENQVEYPTRQDDPRDVHFALTHWVTALAADEIWFNSVYNQRTLLDGLARLFRRLPDQRGVLDRAQIEGKCVVQAPGIDVGGPPIAAARNVGQPLRIAWAARWEHDKGPRCLLDALRCLETTGTDYRLSVMGEAFKDCPRELTTLRSEFAHRLDHVGYHVDRVQYLQTLARADVFVSTAEHEFFGVAVMEAAALGCRLLIPRRLVYPELFGDADVFYDGTARHLAARLADLASSPVSFDGTARDVALRYLWPKRARELDERVLRLLNRDVGQG